MNKYDYTYIIRYRYHEEEDCKIGYYCSNSCDFPTSEELYGYFNLEEGDEVEVEYQIANDFNGGKYLSDTVGKSSVRCPLKPSDSIPLCPNNPAH